MFAIFQFLVANENIASVLSKISVIIFVHYVVYMKYENIIQNVADSVEVRAKPKLLKKWVNH